MTDRIYSARTRFLTFEEADILDRVFTTHLQMLEQQGKDTSQEADLVRQILRDFVYFTSTDTLEELKRYLLSNGWQWRLSQDKHYSIFWSEEEVFDSNPISMILPSSMQYSDAKDLIIRGMYLLAFLAGGPENCSAYDILQQVREHTKSENGGQKE